MSKGVLCSPRADRQTHRQTDRQTDTKVNTEDTLSGFQEFLLQPIIKDRLKKNCHIFFGTFQTKTNKKRNRSFDHFF